MSTTAILFLKSKFKSEIANTGSDEYQAFHPIILSTIYRLVEILFLWTKHIYVHLNNSHSLLQEYQSYNKEAKKNSRSNTVSQHYAELF